VIGYVVLSVALAVGFAFSEAPPPDAPARIAPLRLRMAMELSEPVSEQVVQVSPELGDDRLTTLAYMRD
jgi:hypothetical protein